MNVAVPRFQHSPIFGQLRPVGTFNNFDYHAPMKECIDYIFVSNQIKVLKYGVLTDSYNQRFPSDHQPVMVKLVIGK